MLYLLQVFVVVFCTVNVVIGLQNISHEGVENFFGNGCDKPAASQVIDISLCHKPEATTCNL